MKPSRADHDDAIKAYAAIRASCFEIAPERRAGAFKEIVVHDLGALSTVVVAYTYEERISHNDYGEFLRALTRWLRGADSLVEI